MSLVLPLVQSVSPHQITHFTSCSNCAASTCSCSASALRLHDEARAIYSINHKSTCKRILACDLWEAMIIEAAVQVDGFQGSNGRNGRNAATISDRNQQVHMPRLWVEHGPRQNVRGTSRKMFWEPMVLGCSILLDTVQMKLTCPRTEK